MGHLRGSINLMQFLGAEVRSMEIGGCSGYSYRLE